MHNWDRVSRTKSPVAQKIANHSSGDFEARFSKEVEVILWRSSETAMLSSVYPKVELPTL